MNQPRSPWEWPGIVDRLIGLVGTGLGSTGIAKILSREFPVCLTRNAVIGKRDRLGIKGPAKEPRQAQGETGRLVARLNVRKKPNPPREIPPSDVWNDLPGSRPFLERKRDECAWPVGEGRVCCKPVEQGSYCSLHASIAYTGTGSAKDLLRLAKRFG